MTKKYFFCSEIELIKDRFFSKWIDELNDEICGVYQQNKFFFYSSVCPHFGGEFQYLKKEKILRCKWHGWRFNVINGKSITNHDDYKSRSIIKNMLLKKDKNIGCFPFNGSLKKYNYSNLNGKIFINL